MPSASAGGDDLVLDGSGRVQRSRCRTPRRVPGRTSSTRPSRAGTTSVAITSMKVANASLSQMPFHHAHRHQVAEPHVGQLVVDDVGDALQLGLGRAVGVDQQQHLAEGDAAQVLHRAEREVRHGDQVDLVAGVGQLVVALEEAAAPPRRRRARTRTGVRCRAGARPAGGSVRPCPATMRGSVASSGPITNATR